MTPLPPGAVELDGDQILACFQLATKGLRSAARRIDAINVYPVPDGDTGSNMAATLAEAVVQASALDTPRSARDVLTAIAKGALYGARGNSGVILSQALRGLASVEAGVCLSSPELVEGLAAAARLSYAAVARPVEGTMLTVLAAAAVGARAAMQPAIATVLRGACQAAEEAERATPSQLPALAEAGVTDSGGEGVCVVLRGLLAAWESEPIDEPDESPIDAPIATLAGHHDAYGFCTEFLIEAAGGATLDLDVVRDFVSRPPNRSAVVVGDAALVRVHLHTAEPEAVLSEARSLGTVSRIKVDDMDAQRVRFGALGSGASARVAVLALSPGDGFDAIFEGYGARTLRLEPVAKPSAGDLARAADALRVPDVLLLANHSNVILAARQAVDLATCTLWVVPTTSVPQGVAAALAFDAELPASESAERMTAAAELVTTVEVTRAAADRTVNSVAVHSGQPIALVNGDLAATAGSPLEALLAGLAIADAEAAGIVTLFGGADLTEDELAQARQAVAERFGIEVEAHRGGQELYPYIASVER